MATRPFDWVGYNTLANELAVRADEASRRTAVSRVYYYVYHLALERAKLNGFARVAGEPSHTQLWRDYLDSPHPDCQALAVIAKRLKEKRERADYENLYPRIGDDIAWVLSDAQKFADRLRALPARFPSPAQRRQ